MSSSLKSCCVQGVKHEGTPQGSFTEINGTPVYQCLPKGDYSKDKALLFLPDVFGTGLNNGKLLADSFAAEGFATYVVDYCNGDPIPEDALEKGDFDIGAWFGKHGADVTRPHIDNVMKGLKEQGVKTFGATGYCWGGRYVADLQLEDLIAVAVYNHPSLLKVPDDLEAMKKHSIPMVFNTCETDNMLGPDAQKKADEILGEDKNYERTYWEGCSHGFAVRGDPSDPKAKKGKDGAFEAAIKVLKEKL